MLCPIGPIRTSRRGLPGEIRRAGWRDAPQVGLLLARAHRRASDRHPDALSWYIRPPLIRALILWIAGALMVVVAETWITGAPSACLAIRRSGQPWRFPVNRLALLVVGVGVGAGGCAVLEAPIDQALRALLPPLAVELVLDAPLLILIGFMLAFIAVEFVSNPLRKARERVRRALPEPVWHIEALASFEPGAGRALGQALGAMADAETATLLAEADGRARVRLYRAAGFAPVAWTTRPWGHAAVLVRSPQSTEHKAAFLP